MQEVINEIMLIREAGASIGHWHAQDCEGRERLNDVMLHRQVMQTREILRRERNRGWSILREAGCDWV